MPAEVQSTVERAVARSTPLSLVIGAAIVGAHVLIALIGPWLAPYGPTQMGTGIPFSGVSLAHPFGVDQLGRDVFSRAIHGAWLVLFLSLSGTFLGFLAGGVLGLVSGLRGGVFDWLTMRACELVISIPILVLVLVLVALLGTRATGAVGLIIAVIGFAYAPRVARMARTVSMEIAQLDYVAAARARGDGALRIALREVLPNASGILLVEFALRAAYAPVLVASLGFLGFGLKPPTPEWGLMIAENRAGIFLSPAIVLGPGLMLASLVVGVNLLTDGLASMAGRVVPRET